MKTFNLELIRGCPVIIEGDDIILIDTGSPVTIHESGSLTLGPDEYQCKPSYLGLTVSKLSGLLGSKVTALLGTDILSRYNVVFDYKNGKVLFDKENPDFDGKEVAFSSFMGVPVLKVEIENRSLNMFLDTGASLSYLPENITGNYQKLGIEEDFHPAIGTFITPRFEIPTVFDGNEFTVNYGNLPAILQMTLAMGGCDGIIGNDLFRHFMIMLDLKNNLLKYRKY